MTRSRAFRAIAAVMALVAMAVVEPTASAAEPTTTLNYDAGVACPFALKVEQSGTAAFKPFTDKNGKIVRSLHAGKGLDTLFTNVETGATLFLKANGSVTRITSLPDGTAKYELTGHNILILFPSDMPAGPSTTLYVGRVVFTADSLANFTVQSAAPNSTDICAALSH